MPHAAMTDRAPLAVDVVGRWQALSIIAVAVVLSLTTWFSATAVTPELTVAWHLSSTSVAWLTNAVQLGFVAGALLASLVNLPDIVRLNRLMAASAAFAGLANAGLLLEPGAGGAIVFRLLTGVALAAVYPPAMKLVATWFIRNRGLALGTVIGALSLGSALPHLFRAIGQTFPWQAVVGATSLMAFAAALVFLAMVREGPYPFSKAVFNPRQIGAVFRDRNLLLANIGYFGHMWELYAMWAWLLTFLRASFSVSGGSINPSVLTFLVVAAGIPGCILAGQFADRVGRTLTTTVLMLISGSCALLACLFFDGPTWLLVTIVLIWGLTIVADSAQFSAAITELANPSFVGTALSVQMGLGFGLTVIAIWLMPILADVLGSWRWVFLSLVPGPLIGAWAMMALRRRPEAFRLSNGNR
ncbi:MFS transporter [Aminobacter sp. Piv2-1]|uniref:MFS transporter n=1 Tax=Aminobacter sp. Piv2-1 TaxID=3031122 RepID=UPI0030A6576F